MLTCCIRYEIDPFKREQFVQYAQAWGQAIPRCGAELIGYFAPHEGSLTSAYALYNIESLAAYEAYRRDWRPIRSARRISSLPSASASFCARTAFF
jgi:hypothetical protein